MINMKLLLFTFGFGMGVMVLYFISSKREKKLKSEKEALISEIEKLNMDIKHLKERLSFYTHNLVEDIREFSIRENYKSFDIVLRIIRIAPYREETFLLNAFILKMIWNMRNYVHKNY